MVEAGALVLSPSDTLKFRFELKKQIPSLLKLTNPGTQQVAFKVKTTSPKKYCVRPNTGLIPPGGVAEVQVIMQQQKDFPADMSNCKDKFLVQSVAVGPEVTAAELTGVFADSTESMCEAKLRVTYVSPAPPPSPVQEEGEPGAAAAAPPAAAKPAPASPTWGAGWGRGGGAASAAATPPPPPSPAAAKAAAEAGAAREAAGAAEAASALKAELAAMGGGRAGEAKAGKAAQGALVASRAVIPFTLLHLLLTALVAFCLGRYL